MPEDRLTISSTARLHPEEVARHTFGTTRRGFDPAEVRAFLEDVAREMAAATERQHDLRRAVAEAEHRAAHPVLDDATLTSALGQETARVLQTAHDAAAELTARAESEGAEALARAKAEADQLQRHTEQAAEERTSASEEKAAEVRRRAQEEVTAKLETARLEAEALVNQARTECRTMVQEAQELRARVLADLTRRRRVLHSQIEQLRAGRERLAETIGDVRHAVDSIADELFRAEDEARLAAEVAGRQAAHDELAELVPPAGGDPAALGDAGSVPADEMERGPSVDELFARLRAEAGGLQLSDTDGDPAASGPGASPEVPAGSRPPGTGSVVSPGSASASSGPGVERPPVPTDAERPAGPEPAPREAGVPRPGRPRSTSGRDPAREATGSSPRTATGRTTPLVVAGTAPGAPTEAHPSTDAHADADPDTEADADADDPIVVRRDEVLVPVVAGLARRLKRALQDDQNDILDRVRAKGGWGPNVLLSEEEHAQRYVGAAADQLLEAARAGATFAGGKPDHAPGIGDVAVALATDIVAPLRRRLDGEGRGVEVGDEAALVELVGAAFREWKGTRVERLAGDQAVLAFARGTLAAVAGGTTLRWVVDDEGAECPDCDDNALAGTVTAGEEFPTGHRHPPAHAGCRCLLVPADA